MGWGAKTASFKTPPQYLVCMILFVRWTTLRLLQTAFTRSPGPSCTTSPIFSRSLLTCVNFWWKSRQHMKQFSKEAHVLGWSSVLHNSLDRVWMGFCEACVKQQWEKSLHGCLACSGLLQKHNPFARKLTFVIKHRSYPTLHTSSWKNQIWER